MDKKQITPGFKDLPNWIDFIQSRQGEAWQDEINKRAREIFDQRKAEQEKNLNEFNFNLYKCVNDYHGEVISQEQYGINKSTESFYPQLFNVFNMENNQLTTINRLILKDHSLREFIFPGQLIDLRDSYVKIVAFTGVAISLDYLGKNLEAEVSKAQISSFEEDSGLSIPLLYQHQNEPHQNSDIKILTLSHGENYSASVLQRGLDFKNSENYLKSRIDRNKSIKGLINQECIPLAEQQIPPTKFGYQPPSQT